RCRRTRDREGGLAFGASGATWTNNTALRRYRAVANLRALRRRAALTHSSSTFLAERWHDAAVWEASRRSDCPQILRFVAWHARCRSTCYTTRAKARTSHGGQNHDDVP